MKMSNLSVTAEDDTVMQSHSKESQGCIGIDLCAPDSVDLQGTCIFVTLCLYGASSYSYIDELKDLPFGLTYL